jgi:MFS family permease
MYSQTDLDEAVASGAVSAEAAKALRNYVALQRATPAADEEQFRLITGFNDIFVSIAAVMLLSAVGFIGQLIGPQVEQNGPSPLTGVLVAAAAWGLAMFFTAKRRMALPSIILLLAFVGGVFFAAGTGIAIAVGPDRINDNAQMAGTLGAVSAAIAAAAAWLHWKSFRVPITVAAGAAAVAGIAMGALVGVLGDVANLQQIVLGFMLVLGIGIFLVAMRWDSSDPARVTRRSDVAFWLHLLAAPMIVHPIFSLLGLTNGGASVLDGVIVIALYLAMGVTALAIDRRALLVSALAYVLWALNSLFERFGAVQFNVALTALVIGSALLLLSAFWHQARAAVVRPLPDNLRARLPLINERVSPQPAA